MKVSFTFSFIRQINGDFVCYNDWPGITCFLHVPSDQAHYFDLKPHKDYQIPWCDPIPNYDNRDLRTMLMQYFVENPDDVVSGETELDFAENHDDVVSDETD